MPSQWDEIDRPSPGSWSSSDLDVANHEAGHAVVTVLLGGSRRLVEVRIDRPDIDRLGFSMSVPEGDRSMTDLECELLSTLAGYHLQGVPLALPPEGETRDAQHARSLGLILGYQSVDWFVIGLRLERLFEQPSTHRACRAVIGALLKEGALTGAEVEQLVESSLKEES